MARKTQKNIESDANNLLNQLGIEGAPVPVEDVAASLGLRLEFTFLGDDISGALVLKGDRGTIGINHTQAPVRQRFTIAHEIGHYLLHRGSTHLFIDKKATVVFRRDQDSSAGEQWQEIQANQFAACLLMPKSFIERAMGSVNYKMSDEEIIESLAGLFDVSVQAMSIRLASLGYVELSE